MIFSIWCAHLEISFRDATRLKWSEFKIFMAHLSLLLSLGHLAASSIFPFLRLCNACCQLDIWQMQRAPIFGPISAHIWCVRARQARYWMLRTCMHVCSMNKGCFT